MDNDSRADDELRVSPLELRLVRQVAASNTGTLCFDELVFRNRQAVDETRLLTHVHNLENRGFLSRRTVDAPDDIPDVYFGVTERGQSLLEQAGMWESRDRVAQLYAELDRSARLERIQAWDGRPMSDVC